MQLLLRLPTTSRSPLFTSPSILCRWMRLLAFLPIFPYPFLLLYAKWMHWYIRCDKSNFVGFRGMGVVGNEIEEEKGEIQGAKPATGRSQAHNLTSMSCIICWCYRSVGRYLEVLGVSGWGYSNPLLWLCDTNSKGHKEWQCWRRWNRKLFAFLFVQLSFNFHLLAKPPTRSRCKPGAEWSNPPRLLLTCEQLQLSGTSGLDERIRNSSVIEGERLSSTGQFGSGERFCQVTFRSFKMKPVD